MRRLAPVLALVGCGSGSTTQVSRVETSIAQRNAAPPRVGQHASRITLVAATEDGTTIVSQDADGGTRLWPRLDGTREPMIVSVDLARDLAVTRTSSGFAIVATDEAGGGEIVALAANGGLLRRTKLPPEPAIDLARVRGVDVLLLRADQSIEIVPIEGSQNETRARLLPPAGHRIVGLVTRGSRALALLEIEGVYRGRWIEGTSWGAWTAQVITANPIFEGAALSPSGALLAVPQAAMVSIVDLETAHVEQKRWLSAQRIDFLSENRIAAFNPSSFAAAFIDSEVQTQAVGVGESPVSIGDRVVSGFGAALEITVPERTQVTSRGVGPLADVEIIPAKTQYLGYRMTQPASMRLTTDGGLLAGPGQQLVEVSRTLRGRHTIALSPDPRQLTDAVLLDDAHVLTSHAYSPGDYTLAVLYTHTTEVVQAISMPVVTERLRYEPATELVALTGRDGAYVVRRDAETSKFETWYRLGGTPTDVQLVDPAQADGAVAIAARTDATTGLVSVDRYVADDLVVGSERVPSVTHRYPGTLVGIDARGRVYVRDDEALTALDRGEQLARIPHAFADVTEGELTVPVPVRIAASGDRIAVLYDSRVTLYALDGTALWIADGPPPRDIAWMGDTLVGTFDGALARYDMRTGRLVGATCGWAFGIADEAPLVGLEAGALCDAP